MQLTAEGKRKAGEIAARHGVSATTAEALLAALAAGGGNQAQFSIEELGGMGQWSRGGMVMVGDMFNQGLKARVDALCTELADLAGDRSAVAADPAQKPGAGLFAASGRENWWPEELGNPASAGAQNAMRYAFFPDKRRLAIDLGGEVTVYDTGDHAITGFGQQQSGDGSMSMTSQHGPVRTSDLAVVGAEPDRAEPTPRPEEQPVAKTDGDALGTIERLADLRARGILDEAEFQAKKAELLARL